MAVIAITIAVLLGAAVLMLAGMELIKSVEPPKNTKLKKEFNTLMSAYKDLQKENAELQNKNKLLETEALAYRLGLTWVNVEELNGSQEQ